MKTFYSLEFESGIEKENIYGVQFHPEKSHKYGMKILKILLKFDVKIKNNTRSSDKRK